MIREAAKVDQVEADCMAVHDSPTDSVREKGGVRPGRRDTSFKRTAGFAFAEVSDDTPGRSLQGEGGRWLFLPARLAALCRGEGRRCCCFCGLPVRLCAAALSGFVPEVVRHYRQILPLHADRCIRQGESCPEQPMRCRPEEVPGIQCVPVAVVYPYSWRRGARHTVCARSSS